MKKFSLVIILSFLAFACNETSRPKKPDNLISKDKMSNILYDLYVVNAAKGVNRNLLEKRGIVPETYILTKHNIDSLQFAETNAYYTYYMDDYKAIVEKVKMRLEKEKEKFTAIRDEETKNQKKIKDSIKNRSKNLKDSVGAKVIKQKRIFKNDSFK